MRSITVHDLLPKRVLVARTSAREIASAIEIALGGSDGALELDFAGIEAVTPSFVDEILAVIQEILDREDIAFDRVVVANAPTRLSSKFEAVGRGRNLRIDEHEGSWLVRPS